MKRLILTSLIVFLMMAAAVGLAYAQEQKDNPSEKVVAQCEKLARYSSETGKPSFIAQCSYYLGK